MIKKINNKGFTLVELLAVLVILSAIMGIAIPSITSSMERSKAKQNKSKYEMLESFAELYVTDHKNAVYNQLGDQSNCYINVAAEEYKKYLTDDSLKDVDGNEITGYIYFNKTSNTYTYYKEKTNPTDKSCITTQD